MPPSIDGSLPSSASNRDHASPRPPTATASGTISSRPPANDSSTLMAMNTRPANATSEGFGARRRAAASPSEESSASLRPLSPAVPAYAALPRESGSAKPVEAASDMACAAATGSPTGMNIHRNTYAMTPAPNARAAAANASRTSHTGAPRCRLTPRHTPTRTRPFRGRINGRLGAADGGWARRACHCVRRGACGCRYGLFGWIMVPLCASGEDDMGHNAPVQGTIRVSPDACGGRLLL